MVPEWNNFLRHVHDAHRHQVNPTIKLKDGSFYDFLTESLRHHQSTYESKKSDFDVSAAQAHDEDFKDLVEKLESFAAMELDAERGQEVVQLIEHIVSADPKRLLKPI